MLIKQALVTNTPCLARCLSSSANGSLLAASKKLFDTQNSTEASKEKKTFTRPYAPAKRPENSLAPASNFKYVPISSLPTIPTSLKRPEAPLGVIFEIPERYIKKPEPSVFQPTEETKTVDHKIIKALREGNDGELVKISNEISTFLQNPLNRSIPVEAHPLQRSISGISKMNPSLDIIDEEYLKTILPEERMYSPPYQQDDPLGFAKWHKELIEEQKKERAVEKQKEQEYQNFLGEFRQAALRKSSKGKRNKINRKLIKLYKKLKKDGHFPAPTEITFLI